MKVSATLWRGVRGLCPHCGKAPLFRSFLRQNDACPACREDFSDIRADDAPPWLTILLTGHVVTPFILYCVKHEVFPPWLELTLLGAITIISVLLILPRAKGLFIAAIWMTTQKDKAV